MAEMVGTLRPATDTPPRNAPSSVDPVAAARRLTPRTGLPGGRAALGGLLVALAALALFVALSQSGRHQDTSYVVAARSLPQGATLTPSDLTIRHGAVDEDLRPRTVARLRDAVGRVLLGPVSAGDPLLRHQLADAGAAEVAPQLSFAVSPERALGGTLRVGDHLRVLVTYGQDADAPTQVAAPDVEVLDVRQGSDEALGSSSALVVTVAVPRDQDATALARASSAGKLTLVRLGAAVDRPSTTSEPKGGKP
jgi:Flp pilus assembly protein CpaB